MVYEAFQPKKFFLVLAGLCGALSFLGFLVAGVIPSASTANHGAYPVMGWSITACCLGMAAFFIVRGFDNRPVLRLDTNGIYYRPYSDATVPWDAVAGVEAHPLRGQTIVSFHLRNPDAYPSKNPFTRATTGMNSAFGFGQLGVAATYLTGGPQGVMDAVAHFRPDLFPGRR